MRCCCPLYRQRSWAQHQPPRGGNLVHRSSVVHLLHIHSDRGISVFRSPSCLSSSSLIFGSNIYLYDLWHHKQFRKWGFCSFNDRYSLVEEVLRIFQTLNFKWKCCIQKPTLVKVSIDALSQDIKVIIRDMMWILVLICPTVYYCCS